MIVLLAILSALAISARRRTTEFAAEPENRLQFEDIAPAEIYALDLRQDGAWSGDEAYVEAIDPNFGRSLAVRIRHFAMVGALLLLSGFVYERVGEWRDHRDFPQVGRSVDIGGRSLNLYCSGSGSPTVVFESNWGAPGYKWVEIQRQTAAFARACSYDRAGYGWSDSGPFPNHSDSIARDLHRLLSAAHVNPPYVLAGHAMGAFHIRVFRGYFPDEVAGMVLVDPMSEDLTINIHNHIEFFRPAVLFIQGALGQIGLFRLLQGDPGAPPRGLTKHEWTALATLRIQPKSEVAIGKEPPLWISGELARASGGFGDLPVIVLTAGRPSQEEDPELDRHYFSKVALQCKLAQRSTRGRQIILENSGHDIPVEAPGAVVDAVRSVVEAARQ